MKAKEIRERFEREYEKPRSFRIGHLNLDIYFYPITIEFEQKLKIKLKDLTDDEDRALETVFQKALDEEGERIWTTDEHREFIRKRIPTRILARIFNAMSGISFEDAKKNSKTTRS